MRSRREFEDNVEGSQGRQKRYRRTDEVKETECGEIQDSLERLMRLTGFPCAFLITYLVEQNNLQLSRLVSFFKEERIERLKQEFTMSTIISTVHFHSNYYNVS